MVEDEFVAIAQRAIKAGLKGRLEVVRGAPLLYEIKVDNALKIRVDPRTPIRGKSAFQTDLCVFERIEAEIRIPRVVLEFKASITTHDILTYSSKARKHKLIYPYLRYGIVASKVSVVPGKYFTHNEGLDFMLAAQSLSRKEARGVLTKLVQKEVRASRKMEALAFDGHLPMLARTELAYQ